MSKLCCGWFSCWDLKQTIPEEEEVGDGNKWTSYQKVSPKSSLRGPSLLRSYSDYRTFSDYNITTTADETSTEVVHRPRQRLVESFGAATDRRKSQVMPYEVPSEDEDEDKAEITLSLSYNEMGHMLHVYIDNCKNLPPAIARKNTSNPRVEVCLLPDTNKSNRRKTRAKVDTLHPVFEDKLFPPFQVKPNEVERHQLRVSVWHSNHCESFFKEIKRQIKDVPKICLGEIYIQLNHRLLRLHGKQTYQLQAPKVRPFAMSCDDLLNQRGMMRVKLKFVPKYDIEDMADKGHSMPAYPLSVDPLSPYTLGQLEVRIVCANELPSRESGKPPKAYCKLFLFNVRGTGPMSGGLKQKTCTENSTRDPKWMHTLTYHNVTLQQLAECCLEISVWDQHNKVHKSCLGGVRLSLFNWTSSDCSLTSSSRHFVDSRDSEKELWAQLTSGQYDFWVGSCLMLRHLTPFKRTKRKGSFQFSRSSLLINSQ